MRVATRSALGRGSFVAQNVNAGRGCRRLYVSSAHSLSLLRAPCSARYAYVCCEIFTCEVEAIHNTVFEENGQVRRPRGGLRGRPAFRKL